MSEGAGDAEKLRALLAPLPKEPAAQWQEVSQRCQAVLGPRAWLRRADRPGYTPLCEVGVAGPGGEFEPRAVGPDWPWALAVLHTRMTGGAR